MIRWSSLGLLIVLGGGALAPPSARAEAPATRDPVAILVAEILVEMGSIDVRLDLTAPADVTVANARLHWPAITQLFGRGMRVAQTRRTGAVQFAPEPILLAFKPSFGQRGASVRATIPFW